MRVDIQHMKDRHPIEEVAARSGIELRRCGSAFVGRCPFHPDGGRPNLYVYPRSQRWYCYRCGICGDVIDLVRRLQNVDFLKAVRLIDESGPAIMHRRHLRALGRTSRVRTADGEDVRVLNAAVEVYHRRLLLETRAMEYIASRGVSEATVRELKLGYVAGSDLVPYLRWRSLPIATAERVGLVRRGNERLMGRVVVPEIRDGQVIWMIGRALDTNVHPKYLGLPGRKPLLGWERVQGSRAIYVTEGTFDWLTMVGWGLPTAALLGTHVRRHVLEALRRFDRVHLVLDSDPAGREAAARLRHALGDRATVVNLPTGVKDVAELATRRNGKEIFLDCLISEALPEAA